MPSAPCLLCKLRELGDPREAADPIWIVDVRELCPRCVEHLAAIRVVAERCNFNAIEAAAFVDVVPVAGAGHIIAALALKMARSWGEEKARDILLQKLDQALETIRASPVDA